MWASILCHKLLTGRKDSSIRLDNMRPRGVYPARRKQARSLELWAWGTSISAALAFAKARDLKNEKQMLLLLLVMAP
ncbi:MAG: hypothetical protein CM1200mP16_07740 [Nitrospina sp.]|nr:MAG: hypothetical protein CM1200mP16_07740 [Nitrospina sp.]